MAPRGLCKNRPNLHLPARTPVRSFWGMLRHGLASRNRLGPRCFVGAALAFVAVAAWLVFGDHLPVLERLGIPTMELPFADARTVTGAGSSLAQGLDPLVQNPGDPWGRPLNYPRVWLLLAELGMGPQHTELLAAVFLLAFVLGLAMLVPLATSPAIAAAMASALFSPVAWMLVERGNTDLLLFGLLAAAALLATRHPRTTSALVGVGAALKLYPIFGIAALCTSTGRRSVRASVVMLVAFFGYVVWIHDDLRLIRANTEHGHRISYGIDQVPTAIAAKTGLAMPPLLLVVSLLLVGVVALSAFGRSRARLAAATTPHSLAAFRVGAGVFLGSFCIGSNFDYRLVFLLLVIPQLTTWVGSTRTWTRCGAAAVLVSLQLLLWSMTWRQWLQTLLASETPGLMADELLTWLVVFGMLAALVLSLPDWLVPAARRDMPLLDAPPRQAPIVALPAPAPAPRRQEEEVGALGG